MPYRELLRPPWWVWLVALAAVGLLALEVGYATDVAAGLGCFAVAGAAVLWGLSRSAVLVEVRDGELRAGNARAPLSSFDRALSHDARALRLRRGRDADPAAYLAMSPWVPTGVEVRVCDPADPTPYWLVSSRQPDRLREVLDAVLAPRSSSPPAG